MSRNNIYKNLLVISASFVGLVSHTSVLALANTDSNKTVVNNSQSHVEQDTINLTVTDQKIRAHSKLFRKINDRVSSEYTAILRLSLMQAYARLDFSSISKLNESIDRVFGPYIDKWYSIYVGPQATEGRKVFQELRNELRTILKDKVIALKFYNAYGQSYLNSDDPMLKLIGKYIAYGIWIYDEKKFSTLELTDINTAFISKGIQSLSQDKFSTDWIYLMSVLLSYLQGYIDDIISIPVLKLFPAGKQFKTFSEPTKAEMKTMALMRIKNIFQGIRGITIQYAKTAQNKITDSK